MTIVSIGPIRLMKSKTTFQTNAAQAHVPHTQKARRRWLGVCLFALLACLLPSAAHAADSVCVRVRIEIDQELTLERQGFEASMNLNNGPSGDLTNLSVTVNFADASKNPVVASSDPNNTTAKFFIKLTSSASLPDTLAANAQGSYRWLIVPALAAGGADPAGALYFVGAKLSYSLNGVATSIDVQPDSIRVKPMPQLALDYFLPHDVYGDDPFTPQVEPSIPFSLGVRIRNSGYGDAHQLKIESSQPKIIDNRLGLAVKFAITGSEVNGMAATPSLLADFGTIPSGQSEAARWYMTSSLYGRFTDFSAAFTHSDDLGGTMTSLITNVRTHTLVHDVLSDLAGRDGVKDFLARDDDALRIYESENTDSLVTDYSSSSSIVPSGRAYILNLSPPFDDSSPTTVFSYAQVPDPWRGKQPIFSIVRADGKTLNTANSWLSSTYAPDTGTWSYFLNAFDSNNPDNLAYTVLMGGPGGANHAPMLAHPTSRVALAGLPMNLYVFASDPDNDPVSLSTGPLPAGASFTQVTSGVGLLSWVPPVGQTSSQTIQFTVTDGELSDSKSVVVAVTAGTLRAGWAGLFWPGISDANTIGPMADPDHDGVSNLLEYAFGLDPTSGNLIGMLEPITVEVNGQTFAAVRFIARNDDPDLLISAEATDTLNSADWQPLTESVPQDQTDISSGFQRFVIRDTHPFSLGLHKFFRLRANLSGASSP